MRNSRCLCISIFLILFSGCVQNQNSTKKTVDTQQNNNVKEDSLSNVHNDSVQTLKQNDILISVADSILIQLKNKNYSSLSSYTNPNSTITFSPYGFLDTLKNQRLTTKQIASLASSKQIIKWGTFQGSGEPISLNIIDYFARFVYDVDYIKAEKKSINKVVGYDSSSSNITSVFPNSTFVQYYFSGFKKQYEGMDWKSLVLVFKKVDDRFLLVAVVHNEWKI